MASSKKSRTPNFTQQIGRIMTNLHAEMKDLRREAKKACLESADLVKSKAIPRTPEKTGELKDSFDTSSESRMNGARGIVANDTWYGVIVHEDFTVHHPKGGAKFLENPLLESAHEIRRIFVIRLQI